MSNWKTTAASIHVQLDQDPHLASCQLARSGGADATLACACCGRALWMHGTRHDTCSQFHWVTEQSLTPEQIRQLRCVTGLPEPIHLACSLAINDNCFAPSVVYKARQTCAAAINAAKQTSAS